MILCGGSCSVWGITLCWGALGCAFMANFITQQESACELFGPWCGNAPRGGAEPRWNAALRLNLVSSVPSGHGVCWASSSLTCGTLC